MTRLEEVKAGVAVRGITPGGFVKVVGVGWYGDQAIKVVYEDGGTPGSRLIYRDEESTIEVASTEGPWSFDGDGALLRLVSEANRIRLAHLFDPYLALHSTRVGGPVASRKYWGYRPPGRGRSVWRPTTISYL